MYKNIFLFDTENNKVDLEWSYVSQIINNNFLKICVDNKMVHPIEIEMYNDNKATLNP